VVVVADGVWDEAGGGEDWVDVVVEGPDVCGVDVDFSVCCAEGPALGTSLELLCAKAAVEIRMAAVVVINWRLIMVCPPTKAHTNRASRRSFHKSGKSGNHDRELMTAPVLLATPY
jgi:hypothetical protein